MSKTVTDRESARQTVEAPRLTDEELVVDLLNVTAGDLVRVLISGPGGRTWALRREVRATDISADGVTTLRKPAAKPWSKGRVIDVAVSEGGEE